MSTAVVAMGHSGPKDDLLLLGKFMNLRLREALKGESVASVCRNMGAEGRQEEFGKYLFLKESPFRKDTGQLKSLARKIASYFDISPYVLFPEALYKLALPACVERTYDSEIVLPMLEAKKQRLLSEARPDTQYEKQEVRSALLAQVNTLRPRYAKAIRMRFGLEDGYEHTLEEIAEVLGVGKERVRQIEKKALRNLQYAGRHNFSPFAEYVQ